MKGARDLKDQTIHDANGPARRCQLHLPTQVNTIHAILSHTMYESYGFRKSAPPQNYQLIVCCY
jgi:hypothetical protein